MLGLDFKGAGKFALLLCLLSPFALLSTQLRPSGEGNFIGRVANELTYPFEYAWHVSVRSIIEVWQHYVYLTGVAQENQKLRHDVNALQAKLLDYDEKLEEIQRLRKILGFATHFQREQKAAEVIGIPQDIAFDVVRVSKGSQDGIEVGMPVLTGEGALGRVLRTGFYHADIQMLTDGNFYLDVLLQRTRARGVLRGDFGMTTSLRLNRRAEVRIGDTVVTSGIVGGFPKGIPVGRVVKISYESDNITQTITVEPWVDFFKVEEVIVMQTSDKSIEKIRNTVGESWLSRAIGSGERGRLE